LNYRFIKKEIYVSIPLRGKGKRKVEDQARLRILEAMFPSPYGEKVSGKKLIGLIPLVARSFPSPYGEKVSGKLI